MSGVLRDLKPRDVFYYFEEITKIPHCSGEEENISNYLVSFARKNNLEVIQDEALNVIIKKKATKGYENAPIVILQGHMDMVCEKNKDTVHDFSKDPLDLKIDGDFIRANGTTLGADNGIALAYALAILASNDIDHPALEVLITTEEETGLVGAGKIDKKNLNGKILINIDSEEEGILLVSCAGGIRTKVELPIEWKSCARNTTSYLLTVRGLKGGHSGMEINKERGNSNIILGRILYDLNKEIDLSVYEVSGGAKMNAIPREADAKLVLNEDEFMLVKSKINNWNDILSNELKSKDSGIKVEIEKIEGDVNRIFSTDTIEKLITVYRLIPNGIQSMSMDIEGLVESSTNVGVVTTFDKKIVFESNVRSSVRTLKNEIVNREQVLADIIDGELVKEAEYPEWQYDPDSYIRDVFIDAYTEKFGEKPEVGAIHAGLECGIFKEKLGDIDMISFGPNMYDVHTPDESISISSTGNMWELLKLALKKIK
ncbi:aminoacyl-histidine dipeptidase [Senegalia sp. (in: firmicutes)]|uniref:aminoacyl-histidine dipeptidase n=1 Tax=Senegalia sp. (in: firmicutes) TaxID=1924098 RepID=UPI003F9D80BE